MKRLHCIHRKMSFAAFQRLPHRLGWKHEYYGGRAHIRPGWMSVRFRLNLTTRKSIRTIRIRAVKLRDAAALEEAFLAAFASAPEYAGYPAAHFRKKGKEYLANFFGEVRGHWSPVSMAAEANGGIIGAALVKTRDKGPLLDCIFVRPEFGRRGIAIALAARVVNELVAAGESHLYSYAMLANAPSIAWHHRFGFEEVPDLWVATARWRFYAYEVERLREIGEASEAELSRLSELADHWYAETERLEELEKKDFWSVHPGRD